MGTWNPPKLHITDPFLNSVRWLNPKAKQAFYAASASRVIQRGTWNGCAFNAGSMELGANVRDSQAAAQVFELPLKSVSNFIHQWDNLDGTDEEANAKLRDAIEKVGLFSPRGTIRLRVLMMSPRLMEDQKLALDTILETVSDKSISNEKLWEMIDGYKEAMELIGVS